LSGGRRSEGNSDGEGGKKGETAHGDLLDFPVTRKMRLAGAFR
jgi:hypothetical protein